MLASAQTGVLNQTKVVTRSFHNGQSIEKEPNMNKCTGIFLIVAMSSAMMVEGCSKSPEATVTMPAAQTAAGNVSDIDVTEHVTVALRQSELLKYSAITVVTLKGDVRLTGILDSQAQIDEAIKIARASDGAHTIHDELTIKK
jgi:hyperosmotically inducible periplasmic protein